MEHASLGGLPGVGAVISRPREASLREYRGTFYFRAEHELAVSQFSNSHTPVEFDGLVDGERKRLSVTLTWVIPGSGIAFFNGSGQPY